MKKKEQVETKNIEEKEAHVVAVALIEIDNKLVLLDRTYPIKGVSLIIGHLLKGETPEQALEREVLEETGGKIQNKEFVGTRLFDYSFECTRGASLHEWQIFKVKIDKLRKKEIDEGKLLLVPIEEVAKLNLTDIVRQTLKEFGYITNGSFGQDSSLAKPKMVSIKEIVQETPSIKSFVLDCEMQAVPGQFVMVWLPGIDEKPFTLTQTGKQIAIAAQEKGKFTSALHKLKVGDKVGVRGPYGNGFDFSKTKKACIVAGGCGAAPVLLLAKELSAKKIPTKIILGARTGNECLFAVEMKKNGELFIVTDDGSIGEKAFTTEALEIMLKKEKFDCVFSCGPEPMLAKVFDLCERFGQECQLNLERFMKCGFGICGQCVLDDLRVCKDGPVFFSKQLRESKEFGKIARVKSGREVSLKDYAAWRQN